MPFPFSSSRSSRQQGLLFLHERGGPRQDDGDLLLGTEAINTWGSNPCLDLALETGHPHHIKLIPVRGGDGKKTDPVEQGMTGITGLFKHPFIKGQPTQLAVEKPFRRPE